MACGAALAMLMVSHEQPLFIPDGQSVTGAPWATSTRSRNADANVTSFFESAHKGSIAHALSEVFGARQSLTFRYLIVEFCPTNAHVRPNRIEGDKTLPRIRRYY
jgi:hypothetical protein